MWTYLEDTGALLSILGLFLTPRPLSSVIRTFTSFCDRLMQVSGRYLSNNSVKNLLGGEAVSVGNSNPTTKLASDAQVMSAGGFSYYCRYFLKFGGVVSVQIHRHRLLVHRCLSGSSAASCDVVLCLGWRSGLCHLLLLWSLRESMCIF